MLFQIIAVVLLLAFYGAYFAKLFHQKKQGIKTDLLGKGIYRFSRNPAFLGFDLIYIGVLLLFFNFWLLAITLIAVVMLHLQIVNVEEDFLIDTFGKDYLEYKKTVCRYFGRRRK